MLSSEFAESSVTGPNQTEKLPRESFVSGATSHSRGIQLSLSIARKGREGRVRSMGLRIRSMDGGGDGEGDRGRGRKTTAGDGELQK